MRSPGSLCLPLVHTLLVEAEWPSGPHWVLWEGGEKGPHWVSQERESRQTSELVPIATHLSSAWSKLQVKCISFLAPSSLDPWGSNKIPVLIFFLPTSQSPWLLVKANTYAFLTKIDGEHGCPQQTGAWHVGSSLLQGHKNLLFSSEPWWRSGFTTGTGLSGGQLILLSTVQAVPSSGHGNSYWGNSYDDSLLYTEGTWFSQEICSIRSLWPLGWRDSRIHY